MQRAKNSYMMRLVKRNDLRGLQVTQSLAKIIANACQDDSQSQDDFKRYADHIVNVVLHYRRELKSNKRDNSICISSLHAFLDDCIRNEWPKEFKIPCGECTKACCCHHITDTGVEEAELILKHIETPLKDYLDEDAWDRMHAQANAIEGIKSDAAIIREFSKLDHRIRKCIFLDNNNRCRVYEVRPMRCRTFYVAHTADNCIKESPEHPLAVWSCLQAECFLSAVPSIIKTGHLASIFKELVT